LLLPAPREQPARLCRVGAAMLDLPEGVPLQWTVGVALVAICWALIRNAFAALAKPGTDGDDKNASGGKADGFSEATFRDLALPREPHLEIAMDPPCGLHHSNPQEPFRFENDLAYGEYLFFHPPTEGAEPSRPLSGGLNYEEYFRGKTRIWELRVQFHFKQAPDPDLDLFFGTESEEYVPLAAAAKQVLSLAVATVRTAVGGLYHTPGDDPKQVSGEVEKPCFMLPLWAFDQFIETPEGEKPPTLSDVNFPSLGSRRYGRTSQYVQEISELKRSIRNGPTYTFAFWGSSRFGDVINWRLLGIPMVGPIDLDRFVGKPPLYCVLYSLAPDDQGEKRHLASRKRYFFRAAIWSSLHRPQRKLLEALTGLREGQGMGGGMTDATDPVKARGRTLFHRRLEQLMGRAAISCCEPRIMRSTAPPPPARR